MEGFALVERSELRTFITDLEATVKQGWEHHSVRYLRFGTKVVEWPRDRFIKNFQSRAFYHEPGISETTNIDALIAKANPAHVSLVITDLFQTDADVNSVVGAIKDGFIAKGIPVGVLPVPSQFAGTVFDARVPAFQYRSNPADPKSRRPFYLMIFGAEAQIQRLVAVFSDKRQIDSSQFLLVAPRIVAGEKVALVDKSRSRNFVATKAPAPNPNEFTFDLKDDRPATVEFDAELQPRASSAPLDMTKLETVISRRRVGSGKQADGPVEPAPDLVLAGPLRVEGAHLRVPLRVDIKERDGTFAYRVNVQTATVGSFLQPKWVGEWSSDDPRPGHEPNKTLNLDSFVRGLLQAIQSTSQSPVLRFFLTIRKQ